MLDVNSSLEENLQVAHDVGTADRLSYPSEANDFCSSKIVSFEQIPPPCALRHILFHLVGMFNHCNRFVGIEARIASWRRQTKQRGSSTCLVPSTDMPPRRFWSKSYSDCNWDWPDPLHRKWNPVCPLIVAQYASTIDTSGDELAHDPAPNRRQYYSFATSAASLTY